MMYNDSVNGKKGGFPDPLADEQTKSTKAYGLKYAKAIEKQWGKVQESYSLQGKRNKIFEKNREYANGTQNTNIYKQLLNSFDPNNGDGSLLNMDFTPVPILPKFVKIVVNKILSRNLYPNLEAIDPLSSSEKNERKKKIRLQVDAKKELLDLKEKTGVVLDMEPESIPDTPEEAEIMLETNIKTDAEIAAQLGTEATLGWNQFNDNVFRRAVKDLAVLGTCVVKRSNDPNEGIKLSYVDPSRFIHSYSEDPGLNDLIYAGHIKTITIQELKRLSVGELEEEDFKKIAKSVQGRSGNDSSLFNQRTYDQGLNKTTYGYDEYMVDILDFEYISVDTMHFEEKENQFGNTGFYFKGMDYKPPKSSVFERKAMCMEINCVYKGSYVMGADLIYGYGKATNVPKNMHDLSKAQMSYSAVSTNIMNMVPKSMVDSCIGFADMLQLTHLKLQQAIAKAKPDGLIIDIEGLENVQLGKGGELQPLDLHDIYEQTGVFYYRSKNPEGGFQNPPVREIGNSIRNINELIGLYNHYLRMIRDVTGINEAMDASTPKGDALVGVQQQAIAAGNNAIYDITNASMILYKKVCQDVVKCLQIIPEESILHTAYMNAIGSTNMKALQSFKELPMYNFGVIVSKDMEDKDKSYLEQNIQISLQQKEIDLEDAISIRNLKDVNQAERLLVVRRKKRMQAAQQSAMQNSQMQAQQAAQASQQAAEQRMQEVQMQAQVDAQKMQLKAQLEMQLEQMKHEFNKEIETIKAQASLGFKEDDQNFREKLEVLKEEGKDRRIEQQAEKQGELLEQRQTEAPVMKEKKKDQQAIDLVFPS